MSYYDEERMVQVEGLDGVPRVTPPTHVDGAFYVDGDGDLLMATWDGCSVVVTGDDVGAKLDELPPTAQRVRVAITVSMPPSCRCIEAHEPGCPEGHG